MTQPKRLVMGDVDASAPGLELPYPVGLRRVCASGRTPQRDRLVCWYCDETVSPEAKLAARRKRSARVLADVDMSTPMSRRHAREALAQAVLDGDVNEQRAGVVRSLIADQAKEESERQAPKPPVVVEVQRYGQNGEQAAS